jgi:uncharacterized protein (DUF1800 family)
MGAGVLSTAEVVDRLTLGAAPGLADTLRAQTPAGWIEAQFSPGDEPQNLVSALGGLDAASLDPPDLLARYRLPPDMRKDVAARKQFQKNRRDLYRQSAQARLLYGVYSPWQLRELLVDFWFNHFNIFAHKGLCALWTGAFERQAIRPHVLGRFETMLLATARHPAMLTYLDNRLNSAPGETGRPQKAAGFNENYAREVMELHTIGTRYTQADVIGATRLLTGWSVDRDGRFRFFPRRHDFAPQTILGRSFGGYGNGEAAIESFLRFLAQHPDTAQHLAFEMAQYFVADAPPPALVQAMAASYRDSEGDLRAMTRTMIAHDAFAAAAARRDKFRTPYRYVMALLRAGGRAPDKVQPLIGSLNQLGQPLYGCVQPNGWANTQSEWLSSDALAARVNFAVALGGGWMVIDPRYARGVALDAGPLADTIDAPADVRAAARNAPARLQAAVLLGSPRMQYC